jgi:hypothetical protein
MISSSPLILPFPPVCAAHFLGPRSGGSVFGEGPYFRRGSIGEMWDVCYSSFNGGRLQLWVRFFGDRRSGLLSFGSLSVSVRYGGLSFFCFVQALINASRSRALKAAYLSKKRWGGLPYPFPHTSIGISCHKSR